MQQESCSLLRVEIESQSSPEQSQHPKQATTFPEVAGTAHRPCGKNTGDEWMVLQCCGQGLGLRVRSSLWHWESRCSSRPLKLP
eukprot:5076076-Amphidinium_carterae.1